MKKEIPATTIVYCDVCGKECQLETNRKMEGELIINKNKWDGSEDNSLEYDLCDDCLNSIVCVVSDQIDIITGNNDE